MATATAHIFNVDHGDCSLIHLAPDDAPEKWILIDCNVVKRGDAVVCPAQNFLVRRGVRVLDLVVVSHFHQDHYLGIDRILDNFEVRKIAIPPLVSEKSKVFQTVLGRYKTKILDAGRRTGKAPSVNANLQSLATLIRFLHKNEEKVMEASGPESPLRMHGTNLQFTVLLPLKRMKGVLIQRILDDKFELDHFPEMNDASVVVTLEVHGTRLAWMADSTLAQWQEHRRNMKRDGIACLNLDVVKVPHHGSRDNNGEWLYEYAMRGPLEGRKVLVSANGRSHPHEEFLRIVERLRLVPYCTNLAAKCVDSDVLSIEAMAHIPPAMRPFLLNYGAHKEPIPCQGDITIRVGDAGATFTSSTGAPCVYDHVPGRLREHPLP